MLSFVNDYSEGAHEKILKALVETNMEVLSGYGNDRYTRSARERIGGLCKCPPSDVYFLSGGTQTNKTVIASMLAPYEGVVSALTGHISTHEAGAIEHTGHKVLTVPHKDGKILPTMLRGYLNDFYADDNHTHMVIPGMVYISFPTEYGTLYSKNELIELYKICKEYRITLFVDGARLGYGLASKECEVTISEIAQWCDVLYIGGTKVGALCGEAVVFTKNNTPRYFRTSVKQEGALMAKGRLLGIQFDVLFTDELYFQLGKHANDMAYYLKGIFREKGYQFYVESPTNQIFIILDNVIMKELALGVEFAYWEKFDESHTVVRFATSWATSIEAVQQLECLL